MNMDGIALVDSLVLEYLLYRGSFYAHEALLTHIGKQPLIMEASLLVTKIQEIILKLDASALSILWNTLNHRFFSRCPDVESTSKEAKKLLLSLQQHLLIEAVRAKKVRVITAFFSLLPPEELIQLHWASWLTIPYLTDPCTHPSLSSFFTRQWREALFISLHNFLATSIHQAPLPELLSLHMRHLKQQACEVEISSLRAEIAALRSNQKDVGRDTFHDDETVPLSTAHTTNTHNTHNSFQDDENDEKNSTQNVAIRVKKVKCFAGHSDTISCLRWQHMLPASIEQHSMLPLLATSSLDGTVRVWQDDSRSTPLFCSTAALSVEWQQPHLLLCGTADAKVKLWDVISKRVLYEIDTKASSGSATPQGVNTLCASPTQSMFVVANASPSTTSTLSVPTLTSWSLKTGKIMMQFDIECSVTSLAFNHNGNILAVGFTSGVVKVIDVLSGATLMQWLAHSYPVTCLQFGIPDETSIVSSSAHCIIEWNLHKETQVIKKLEAQSCGDFSFDSLGRHLLTSDSNGQSVIYDWSHQNVHRVTTELPTHHNNSSVVKVNWLQQYPSAIATAGTDHSIIVSELSTRNF